MDNSQNASSEARYEVLPNTKLRVFRAASSPLDRSVTRFMATFHKGGEQ